MRRYSLLKVHLSGLVENKKGRKRGKFTDFLTVSTDFSTNWRFKSRFQQGFQHFLMSKTFLLRLFMMRYDVSRQKHTKFIFHFFQHTAEKLFQHSPISPTIFPTFNSHFANIPNTPHPSQYLPTKPTFFPTAFQQSTASFFCGIWYFLPLYPLFNIL